MNKTVLTPFGRITPITLKKFVKIIPRMEWPDKTKHVHLMQQVKKNQNGPFVIGREYIRKVFGFKEICDNVNIEDFTKDLSINKYDKYELIEMICDAGYKSAIEMGEPTHAILLRKRTWLLTNPKYFTLHFSNNGYTISNSRPYLSICWEINK